MQKRILITNDDGYEAEGILALRDALSEIAEVVVVAPSTEKSACAHSITLHSPMRFIGIDDNYYKLDNGTPSDCIYLAIHSMFSGNKPDLVISGINRGANMGEDITYSGTCAGAMEAVLHDIPAIAMSQVMTSHDASVGYDLAARTAKKLARRVLEGGFPLPHRHFLNVNIPPNCTDAEMEVTYAGYRFYGNDAHLHRNPRGEEYYWLGLHPLEFKAREGHEGMYDYEAILNNKISVTPVMLDLTAYKSMQSLRSWL